MLSKKEIKALMDGTYGVTRNGIQVKYIGKTRTGQYGWTKYRDGYIDEVDLTYAHFCRDFLNKESPLDIVGLWEDKPEPFNLERALKGEPIVKDRIKYWVVGQLRFMPDYFILKDEKGKTDTWLLQVLNKKFAMWKEPKPINSSDNELPKPIKDFGGLEVVWFITCTCRSGYYPQALRKLSDGYGENAKRLAKSGVYYATREDCQKVCNWLMNR